jgi:DUF1680 family protein
MKALLLTMLALAMAGLANAQTIKPIAPSIVPDVARPLPLAAVRLTGGPLKHAQDLDADYLLKLEPDRMMAFYRKRAGLEPKAQPYGGWDGDGRSFTCCVGTGMESHALHGDGLYYEAGDKLWVNIYAPSTAKWGEVDLTMDTTFPEGDGARLKLTLKASKQFTLALRRPSWAGEGFTVKVNGQAVKQLSAPGTYIELKRKWKSGDTVTLALVKTLRLEPLPDNPNITAIMWGPIVLAGDLGPERERRRGASGQMGGQAGAQQPAAPIIKIPSLVAAERTPSTWIKATAELGTFRTAGAGREQDVDLVPFYRLHRRTYSVYFDLFTPAEWEKKAAALRRTRHERNQIAARAQHRRTLWQAVVVGARDL